MKHFLSAVLLAACALVGKAQTDEIDNFTVGPYDVEYMGQGDVRYRLRSDVDLYEFFELQKDTVVIKSNSVIKTLKRGIQIDGKVGSNRYEPKELGLEGMWKQNVYPNLYLNGGLSFTFDFSYIGDTQPRRTLFELGIPLQVEYAKLSHDKACLYGVFGLTPTIYSTMMATKWDPKTETRIDANKESGFVIAPVMEFGSYIPVGPTILRVGVYGTFKFNCTTRGYDIFSQECGRLFFGAKIGVII